MGRKIETGALTHACSSIIVLSLRGGRGPGGCCWTLSPKAPRPGWGCCPWCQMLELLSLPRASNSVPSRLCVSDRESIFFSSHNVSRLRVLIGPDRGMSLHQAWGWGDVGSQRADWQAFPPGRRGQGSRAPSSLLASVAAAVTAVPAHTPHSGGRLSNFSM